MLKSRPFRAAVLPVLAALVALSSPVQAQFSDGYKFLEAIRKKDGTTVNKYLAEPGSQLINTKDVTSGDTALHIVTARRDLTWMGFLIGKGANVNARNGRGVSPLMVASAMGFLEGVDLLIAYKARVDEPDQTGETPLISAVHRKDIAMMRILLKAGADPDRADNSGRSARDYATLDGRGSNLLQEIETNAKPKTNAGQPRKIYGPSF